ncbi:hypothetical protein OG871_02230 [Kitasatospora sp. NBC_00374]|uniref:hypothetical protein n=1 Tax=Kitasatospora sp. NBC_00374 TaxID=2975964 RepID=UPI0030E23E02
MEAQQKAAGAPEAAQEAAPAAEPKNTEEHAAAPPTREDDRPDRPDLLYQLGGARQGDGGQHRLYAESVGGDQFTGGKHYHYHRPNEATGARPGRVSPDELRALAGVYVSGPADGEAVIELGRRHVLLLQGAPRSGRKAAALRLLHAVGDEQVFRLDPDTDLARFPEESTARGGYLLAEPVTRTSDPLRGARIAVLGERLAAHGSFLVIVLDPQAAVSGVHTVRWRPADADRVLRAHLRQALVAARREPDGPECERLLALPQTAQLLAGHHGPARLRYFADLLVRHLDGDLSEEQLGGFVAESATGQVAEVLDDPALDLRDKAFLLALAVFEDASYQQIVAESDALTLVLRQAEDPERHLGLPRFDRDRARLLELAHAFEAPSVQDTDWGRVPATKISFRDPGAGLATLRHLWLEHPAAREPVAEWLNGLARSEAPLHRVRAAVAAGLLTTLDFESGFQLFVAPWAASSGLRLRQLAAWSLQVAAEAGLLPLVQRLLRDWSRDGGVALRWTAARAYATFGVDHPSSALRDLELIARDEARQQLREVVLGTLGTLMVGGWPGPVLSALVQWSRDPSPELRDTCFRAFLLAVLEWDTGDDASDPWPRLLRIGLGEGESARSVRVLWRAALESAPFGGAAVEALRGWLHGAERRHGLVVALTSFLPTLVETDRERARLDHLLRQVARAGGLSAQALAELRHPLTAPAPQYAGNTPVVVGEPGDAERTRG